jgi:hypothetical protein
MAAAALLPLRRLPFLFILPGLQGLLSAALRPLWARLFSSSTM